MATLNLAIGSANDDALQFSTGGATTLDQTAQRLNSAEDIHGLRFTNVTIPAGATVSAASLKLYIYNTTYDTLTATAACEDADNAAAFSTAADDIYDRTKTTATAAISVTDVAAGGADHYEVCDLASAVQEVVDRVGWSSGNALVVILYGWTAGDLYFRSYDFDSAQAAKLDITYTVASGVPRQAMYYARIRT